MKRFLKPVAWLLALCLLAASAPCALADDAYVWVGMLLDTSLPSTAASTITITSVSVGGTALPESASNDVWFSGGTVSIVFSDTETDNTYTYDVSTDGGVTFAATGLSGGFTLDSLGLSSSTTPYSMVFRVNDAADSTNSAVSGIYYVYVDNDAPVLLCKAGTDNTLNFYAGDDVSGFSTSEYNVTVTASEASPTWIKLLTEYGQGVYTAVIQYSGEGTIPAGTLGVRDKAGNIAVWGEDIIISATGGISGGSTMSSGGSMSSSGGSSSATTSRTVYYAANTDDDTVTPYNGVDLVVENGNMSALTIGDQTLNLTLQLFDSDSGVVYTSYQPVFSASFADWNGSGTTTSDAEDDNDMDTLVLTASDAETSEDADYAYEWTFDGSVYKKLAASGIDYLVFSDGDGAMALSTAGFTAGLRYNMYRAAGLSSKSFVYTVRMGESGMQMQVTVDGKTYTMTDDETSEIYYYDLYMGTMDMLDYPFGQESGQTATDDGRNG